MMRTRQNIRVGAALLAAAWLGGCAAGPRHRAGAEYASFFNTAKKIAVMPLDVKIYQLSAGGIPELMDNWTGAAKESLKFALTDAFAAYPLVQLVFLEETSLTTADKELVNRQLGMYRALLSGIITHTYSPGNTFPHKLKHFDYSFGADISGLSSLMQADAYLFCSGTNTVWSAGRANLAAFGILVGALTGVAITPGSGPEWFSLTLADANTGNVVWFDFITGQGDLRSLETSRAAVKTMLTTLPRNAR